MTQPQINNYSGILFSIALTVFLVSEVHPQSPKIAKL